MNEETIQPVYAIQPVYVEFREEIGVPLGSRIPSLSVPAPGELVTLRGVIYRAVSRSWLYDGDDDDTCYCIIRVEVHA